MMWTVKPAPVAAITLATFLLSRERALPAGTAVAWSMAGMVLACGLAHATAIDREIGEVRWDGQNNFMQGTDLYRVKQLQNGKWNVVWPRDVAAPGARLLTP